MNVYSTIYSGGGLEVQVSINPRTPPEKQPPPHNPDEDDRRCMRSYKSRLGFQSLVFDPVVSITVGSKDSTKRGNRVVFNIRYAYQIMSTITSVYEDMISNRKIYLNSDRTLILDRAAADAYARKIPTYSHELRIKPSIVETDIGGVRGLEFSSDMGHIATISHMDARLLVESLERFDATTYTLLLGLSEQLGVMDVKMDKMKGTINEIRDDIKKIMKNLQIDEARMGSMWHPMR